MRPLRRRIFNHITVTSLILFLASGLAFLFLPRNSRVLTFSRAHSHYWEFAIIDGTYSVLAIEGYTRNESPHWIGQSVLSNTTSDPWRTVYIDPNGYCVIGPDQKSMIAPWPKGWPSEMLTGRDVPYHCITIPAYFPPIIATFIPAIWLAMRLVGPATDRYRQQRHINYQRCANCGYDLRATPNCCPECGQIPKETA